MASVSDDHRRCPSPLSAGTDAHNYRAPCRHRRHALPSRGGSQRTEQTNDTHHTIRYIAHRRKGVHRSAVCRDAAADDTSEPCGRGTPFAGAPPSMHSHHPSELAHAPAAPQERPTQFHTPSSRAIPRIAPALRHCHYARWHAVDCILPSFLLPTAPNCTARPPRLLWHGRPHSSDPSLTTPSRVAIGGHSTIGACPFTARPRSLAVATMRRAPANSQSQCKSQCARTASCWLGKAGQLPALPPALSRSRSRRVHECAGAPARHRHRVACAPAADPWAVRKRPCTGAAAHG